MLEALARVAKGKRRSRALEAMRRLEVKLAREALDDVPAVRLDDFAFPFKINRDVRDEILLVVMVQLVGLPEPAIQIRGLDDTDWSDALTDEERDTILGRIDRTLRAGGHPGLFDGN